MSYKYHEYIDKYINDIKEEKIRSSKRLRQAMDIVEKKLNSENIFIDESKIEESKRVIERYFKINFKIKLLNWQLFILGLIHCYKKMKIQ